MKLQPANTKQTSSLMKLGFPVDEYGMFTYDRDDEPKMVYKNEWNRECYCHIPSLEEVAKWLRQEKGLIVEVNYTYDDTYHWSVIQKKQPSKMKQYGVIPLTDNRTYQNTYEEALSAGIDKAIEILKEK